MRIRPRLLLSALTAVFLLASLACMLSARMVELDESSMEPNFPQGTRLRVEEINLGYLKRGDLIFYSRDDDFVVRRVIGFPGEEIKMVDGLIYVNGYVFEEDYRVIPDLTSSGSWIVDKKSWYVEEDEYFVLGDNRPKGSDSRLYGPIKASDIKGIALPIEP